MGIRTAVAWAFPAAVVVFAHLTDVAAKIAMAEDVVWVNELETDSKLIGREVVVEGRFKGRVGANLDQIKLQSSNVHFQLSPELAKRFPSGLRDFVRVTGALTKSEGKLVMRVTSLARISSTDVDRFNAVAATIQAKDYRRWNELADRIAKLADFYGDDELRGFALKARLNGFRAEEASFQPPQADKLLTLAGRVAEVGLDEDESRRMRHKALRWRFDALAAASPTAPQWSELADNIAKLLPGTKTPNRPDDVALVTRYRMKSLDVYEADLPSRDLFDREFWVDVTARAFVAASEQPGAEVFRLSADAKRLLTDRPEVGHQLLAKWAEAEAARVPTLPPTGNAGRVRKLAEIFRTELGKPDRAQQLLRQWLDLRRRKLNERDADGRVKLARDYKSDVQDISSASKLLLEAIAIEPDLPDAIEELKSLGFEKGPEGWVRSNDPTLAGRGTANPSIRGRLPEPRMTPDQVRQILGDPKPEDIVRLGTAGRFIEHWTYKGPPDIHVTFRLSGSSRAEVISINTQTAK